VEAEGERVAGAHTPNFKEGSIGAVPLQLK